MNRKIKLTVSTLALAASLGAGTVAVGNLASVGSQLAQNKDYAKYLTLRETRRILSDAKKELAYEKGSGGVGVGIGSNPSGNPGLGIYTGTGGTGIGVGYVFVDDDHGAPGPAVYATMPEPDKFPNPAKAKELIGGALNRLGQENGVEYGLKVVQESLPNEWKETKKSDDSMYEKHRQGIDTAIKQIELRENSYSVGFSDLQNKQALSGFLLGGSIVGSVLSLFFGILSYKETE